MYRYTATLITALVMTAALFGVLRIASGQNRFTTHNTDCIGNTCIFIPLVMQPGERGNAPDPGDSVEEPLPSPTATASPTPTATVTATAIPTSTPSPNPDIVNGDFDLGPVGWNVEPQKQNIITNDLPDGIIAHSGDWVARLGNGTDPVWGVGQIITVPADRPFLSFWYRVLSDKPQCDDKNLAFVAFMADGEEKPYIFDENVLCERATTENWLQRAYDLRPVAGKTGTLVWGLIQQGTSNSSIFIDTVTFRDEQAPGLFNGDFEEKLNSWEEGVAPGKRIIRSDLPDGITPQSGEWAAWLGGEQGTFGVGINPDNGSLEVYFFSNIAQNVTIPSNAAYLTYWYAGASESPCANESETTGRARVSFVIPDQGQGSEEHILDTLYMCPSVTTNEWKQRTVDVSNYQGLAYNLGILVRGPLPQNNDFFIDNIAWQDKDFNIISQQRLSALPQPNAALSVARYLDVESHLYAKLDSLLHRLHRNPGGY